MEHTRGLSAPTAAKSLARMQQVGMPREIAGRQRHRTNIDFAYHLQRNAMMLRFTGFNPATETRLGQFRSSLRGSTS